MRLLALVLALVCATAEAQSDNPSKWIRMIVPFPPGGSDDVVARLVSAQLPEKLGQPVVVDNRGSAGDTIGIKAAAASEPDEYTLPLVSIGYPLSIALGWMSQESLQSFAPVASLGTGPSIPSCTPSPPERSAICGGNAARLLGLQ